MSLVFAAPFEEPFKEPFLVPFAMGGGVEITMSLSNAPLALTTT
jgi:hypothetical protein